MINEVKMRMRRCDISFGHRQKLAKIMSQMARKGGEELGTSIYYQGFDEISRQHPVDERSLE